MNTFTFFSQNYWSDTLSEGLDIWYDNIEHEPENGIYHEFEWEALDGDNKDRRYDMSDDEQYEVEKKIRDYISDPNNRDDGY
jgi:hypothetical protein